MNDQKGMTVLVAGAGVFGLAIALALARAGAAVRLIDPTGGTDSASAIAAGMLAPAFEAALDAHSAGHFALLRRARDLWPAFAEDLGPTGLVPCGATMTAAADVLARAAAGLAREGASFETIPGGLFTSEDWRIEPSMALAAMRARLSDLGGRLIAGTVTTAEAKAVTLAGGERLTGEAVVLACGYAGLGLAAELAVLAPIKGQILRYDVGALNGGPILRGEAGYVVPSPSGPAAGATMQAGVSDRDLEPDVIRLLTAQAERLAPTLAGRKPAAFAGVRPATPDGLPLIGQAESGVWLASGARRNGWLLAPLAAALTLQGLTGGAVEPAFAPGRFSLRR